MYKRDENGNKTAHFPYNRFYSEMTAEKMMGDFEIKVRLAEDWYIQERNIEKGDRYLGQAIYIANNLIGKLRELKREKDKDPKKYGLLIKLAREYTKQEITHLKKTKKELRNGNNKDKSLAEITAEPQHL